MARRGTPDLAVPIQVYRATLISPFCRLVYEVISKNRLDSPPPLSGRHQLIDPPLCSPSESAEILADFSRRLEVIVSYCEQIGALPILIIPPANEAGYEPSRSTVPPSVSANERRRLVDEFEVARNFESSDPARSVTGYTGDPRPARRISRRPTSGWRGCSNEKAG